MKRLKAIKSEMLKSCVYTGELSCGMRAFFWPMPGFTRRFALISVKYGSVDNVFVPPGENRQVEVPEGIAHFLEHKLFEGRKGDVGERFSALGASCNAMTSFTSTTYYFSCTDNFDRCLRLLLGFVRRPDFSPGGVEREKSIIAQEIMMERDNPDWCLFFNMLQAMYARHPARLDIAGTLESVARIDRDLLLECHRTFYHPGNMVLVVAGDIDPDEVAAVADRGGGAAQSHDGNIRRIMPDEPLRPARKSVTHRMPVTRPKVLVGFKEEDTRVARRGLFRRDVLTALVIDTLLGRTSRLYNDLYSRGLIDGTFSASYSSYEGFGYSAVGGDTDRPQLLVEAIGKGLECARRNGLNAREFRRKKKKAIGGFLGTFDSPESSAMLFAHFHMLGVNVFDYFRVLSRLRLSDADERLRSHLCPKNCVVSTVLPRKGKR